MKKPILVVMLIAIILLSGCHSFYKIGTNDLKGISNKDVVQIKFVNGKKLNITNIQHANITINQNLEIIKYSSTKYKIDSVRTLYSLDEIKEIRVEKFNFGKAMFTTILITVGIAFSIVVLWPGGFSIGG